MTTSPTDRAAMREQVRALHEKLFELRAGCLERGAVKRGELWEFKEIKAEFEDLRNEFLGDLPAVQALMGGRVFTAADYKEHLKMDVEREGPLPHNILEVLEMECPINGPGHKVKDTHLLAWVPKKITLTKLSKAVGGQAELVLYGTWFINHESGIGKKHLAEGRWVLIPNKCPPQTKDLNWADSRAALKAHYPDYEQADALSFATALVLNCLKNDERWYPGEWGWCSDRLGSGPAAPALSVGFFLADGLLVVDDHPVSVDAWRGAACFWNFGAR